jgi:hypothetical protein
MLLRRPILILRFAQNSSSLDQQQLFVPEPGRLLSKVQGGKIDPFPPLALPRSSLGSLTSSFQPKKPYEIPWIEVFRRCLASRSAVALNVARVRSDVQILVEAWQQGGKNMHIFYDKVFPSASSA